MIDNQSSEPTISDGEEEEDMISTDKIKKNEKSSSSGSLGLEDSQFLMSSVDQLVMKQKSKSILTKNDQTEDEDNIVVEEVESAKKKFFSVPLPSFLENNDDLMRKVTLAWGILTMLISGTLYGFSVISTDVKHILDFDQTEISNAISIGDVGIYIGVTVGFLYDIYGPFFTALIATLFYLIGYLGFYAMINGGLPANAYLLSFFLFLVGQASHASFTASIITNIHNFSLKHRGKVSGALVGLFATSSGVFGIIYRHTFSKTADVKGYLLFLTIVCAGISFIGAFLIRCVGVKIKESNSSNSLENELGESTKNTEDNRVLLKSQEIEEDSNNSSAEDRSSPNYIDGKRDITGFQLIKTEEFWLLFICYYFIAGCCLMFLNNIGSVGKSLGKSADLRTDLVIVFAASNLTGRSSFGLLSDLFVRKISRFWFLVISASIITITHFFYAFFADEVYILAVILTGIGYGGLVATMVLLTSVRFGVRRFGLNFGLLAIASAAGSLSFGFIYGKLYDAQADEELDECFGYKCFRTSFILSAVFNALCIGVVLLLIYRSKRHTY